MTIDLLVETIEECNTFGIGSFTVDPPPPVVLGAVSGGQLILNVGSRADERLLDVDNENELFRIRVIDEPVSSSGQTVQISAFGRRQEFPNVTSIKGNFGGGTDAIEIDAAFIRRQGNLNNSFAVSRQGALQVVWPVFRNIHHFE